MTSRHELLKLEDVYDHKNSSELFLEAMRECLSHHVENFIRSGYDVKDCEIVFEQLDK